MYTRLMGGAPDTWPEGGPNEPPKVLRCHEQRDGSGADTLANGVCLSRRRKTGCTSGFIAYSALHQVGAWEAKRVHPLLIAKPTSSTTPFTGLTSL